MTTRDEIVESALSDLKANGIRPYDPDARDDVDGFVDDTLLDSGFPEGQDDEIREEVWTKFKRDVPNLVGTQKGNSRWLIVAQRPYSDHEGDGHLAYVLAVKPTEEGAEYATWLYNHTIGGYGMGHYFDGISGATDDFKTR